MNYKLSIKYKGSNYHGWAVQPNNKTIQGEIENIIYKLFNIKVKIIGSGRTDTGVHAVEQVVNIDNDNLDIDPNVFMKAINSQLDYDIRVFKCEVVSNKFHARFNAKVKTYKYIINTNDVYNVFENDVIYQYNKEIDLDVVEKIKKLFLGKHNFLSFSTSEVKDTIREVTKIEYDKSNDFLIILITGNGFLRSQVRMMIGAMIALNEKKVSIKDLEIYLKKPMKGSSCYKAPACGLYLYDIEY